MSLTQEHLDKLDEMIASGQLSSTYKDRTINFDSFEELVKRRQFVAKKLGKAKQSKASHPEFDPDLW